MIRIDTSYVRNVEQPLKYLSRSRNMTNEAYEAIKKANHAKDVWKMQYFIIHRELVMAMRSNQKKSKQIKRLKNVIKEISPKKRVAEVFSSTA